MQARRARKRARWILFVVVALCGGVSLVPCCYVLLRWRER
jgi:glucose-6-phosphate-specific signal transduction histidine kinase